MTALTVVPTPSPDYATRPDQWARQHMNSAAYRLEAQLREHHRDWRHGRLSFEEWRDLRAAALAVYVAAAHHPLVVEGAA